jgi:cellulose synthase (UDP-forming)
MNTARPAAAGAAGAPAAGGGALARLLAWCGVAPQATLWATLASLLLARPLDPAGRARWRAAFPHIDFSRLRAGDLLRLPLQLLWLALAVPPQARRGHLRWTFPARARWLAAVPAPLLRAGRALRAHLRLATSGSRRRSERFADHRLWDRPMTRVLAYLMSGVLAVLCITTPFSIEAQTIFVVMFWVLAMVVRRIPGQVVTLLLMVMSVATSTRYLWWRCSQTLNWDQWLDLWWGLLLLAAEVYTWVVLLLGYIQTAWPLRRSVVTVPLEREQWPTVDVFIPTYNEPLSVVKPTLYAAMGLDWPADKLRIHLLDDGRRDEFRRFAAELGVGYMVRDDNLHAKAGNLNRALARTDGEFVAIFDCDHIPTRSFLQVSMGWFVRDPKLALLQTPHHFFSPDPFERNLGIFRSTPNEGELFYGLIQDGNDLWNATFFCGSCAVLRRGPLMEVGGIAVETVTEDAHTALKLQRLGYTSAYLNVPQAAGLATESLSAHIGQRIRWSRGMAQIFRLDNPFIGKGLNWAQRICYGNAMLHFMNGGPRLVFLTAPLAFLLFHAYVIYTPAIAVLLYVLPHMAHANITNSRIQGAHRHSFWAEVYETVLAWYIVRPTLVALIDPHKGKFNVTAKGGLVDREYRDWSIAMPYLVLMVLNMIGFAVGIGRLLWGPDDERGTTLLNLFWTFYNMLILGAAVSVASESKQIRRTHRVQLELAAVLHLPDGKCIACRTEDFSEGGAALRLPLMPPGLVRDAQVSVSLWRGDNESVFPARVASQAGMSLRLRWELTEREQEIALIQCTFARADAWVSWSSGRVHDKPLRGLRKVLAVGIGGYGGLLQDSLTRVGPAFGRASALPAMLASLLPRHPQAAPAHPARSPSGKR